VAGPGRCYGGALRVVFISEAVIFEKKREKLVGLEGGIDMLSENLLKALTRQINREIYSAYFYAAMASYAQSQGFKGAAHWFSQQVKEEIEHAQRMYDYVQQQNKRVMMEAIEAPPQDFQSIADLYKRTLEHEKKGHWPYQGSC
jgi:hypothetical protein